MFLGLPIALLTLASHGPCPDVTPRTGIYRNTDFGFELAVPPARAWVPEGPPCADSPSGCTCMPDHGWVFFLDGPDSPRRIEVYAGYAVTPEDDDPGGWFDSLRTRSLGGRVQITEDGKVMLSGRPARRREAELKTSAGGRVAVSVSAVRDGITYQISLTTTPKNLKADRELLQAVLASFTFRPHAR